MKCECGQEMEYQQSPKHKFTFCVPFTLIEIHVLDFGHRDWICIWCLSERDEGGEKDAYMQGFDDGYSEAL